MNAPPNRRVRAPAISARVSAIVKARSVDEPSLVVPPMPTIEEEIHLLEVFSPAKTIALALNHEGMTREEIDATVNAYEATYRLPTCDPLWHGVGKLVAAVTTRLSL